MAAKKTVIKAVVVLDLIGVVGIHVLYLAEGTLQAVLDDAHHLINHLGLPRRGIHRVSQQHRHPLRRREAEVLVGEPGEDQPFEQQTQLGRDLAEIDGRTHHETVGLGNLFQHGCQRVLVFADVRHTVFQFAGHARHAAAILHVVKPDGLHFNLAADGCGSFSNLLYTI